MGHILIQSFLLCSNLSPGEYILLYKLLLIRKHTFWYINTINYRKATKRRKKVWVAELKSKPQWGTITRQSEWLLSKNLQAINAGEDVEKREPSYTVGGDIN